MSTNGSLEVSVPLLAHDGILDQMLTVESFLPPSRQFGCLFPSNFRCRQRSRSGQRSAARIWLENSLG